jgi:hypothetical protein
MHPTGRMSSLQTFTRLMIYLCNCREPSGSRELAEVRHWKTTAARSEGLCEYNRELTEDKTVFQNSYIRVALNITHVNTTFVPMLLHCYVQHPGFFHKHGQGFHPPSLQHSGRTQSKRFWRWCITLGITGLVDFDNHPEFWITRRLQSWFCSSSGEGRETPVLVAP